MKDFTNGEKPTQTPRIQRPNSSVKNHGGNDINQSNLYEEQVTHVANYTKSPKAINFFYNHKKNRYHVKTLPTMCVSSVNEGKTQVG